MWLYILHSKHGIREVHLRVLCRFLSKHGVVFLTLKVCPSGKVRETEGVLEEDCDGSNKPAFYFPPIVYWEI